MLYFTAGYTGYFLLGHFLNKTHIPPKTECMIYVAGIIGFVSTVLMSLYASQFKGSVSEDFYSNYTVNILCEALAVFVFFKSRLNRPSRIIRLLSQYSFGVYLVHIFVLDMIALLGLNSMTFSPVLSIPVICVIVFIVSFAISAILNHIPVLNKYIV